jgi:hypothetical protein
MQAAAVTASNLATWLAAGQLRERKHAHAGRQARVSVSEIGRFAGLGHSANLSVIRKLSNLPSLAPVEAASRDHALAGRHAWRPQRLGKRKLSLAEPALRAKVP